MGLLDFLPETTTPQEAAERSQLEDFLKQFMISRKDEARDEAMHTFVAQFGESRAIEILIDLLSVEEAGAAETPLSVATAEILKRIGTAAVEPLITALNSEAPVARKRAALALGKIGDQRAVEPLVALLGDRKSYVREATIDALDALGAGDRV